MLSFEKGKTFGKNFWKIAVAPLKKSKSNDQIKKRTKTTLHCVTKEVLLSHSHSLTITPVYVHASYEKDMGVNRTKRKIWREKKR